MKRQNKSGSVSSRKLRRSKESVQRKDNGSSSFVTRSQVNEVVQQLNDNQQTLGKLINKTNTNAIRAFTIQDGHLHVFRRVFNDMAKDVLKEGCEGTLRLQDDGCIDWEFYFNEYERTKIAVALMMWLKKIATVEEPSTKVETKQENFVFGGDYARPNQPAE